MKVDPVKMRHVHKQFSTEYLNLDSLFHSLLPMSKNSRDFLKFQNLAKIEAGRLEVMW